VRERERERERDVHGYMDVSTLYVCDAGRS
jgi:hypothetical protein